MLIKGRLPSCSPHCSPLSEQAPLSAQIFFFSFHSSSSVFHSAVNCFLNLISEAVLKQQTVSERKRGETKGNMSGEAEDREKQLEGLDGTHTAL